MSSKKPPLISTVSSVKDHPEYKPERDHPMQVAGEFNVTVAGDIVQTRCIAASADSAVQSALEPIRSADFAVANLEQAIGDWRDFDGHHYGVGAFLIMAHPDIADDLASIGFDVLSRANNRLSDFGAAGNRLTDAHLRAVGIQPVGFGEHLSDAQAPVYVDTPKARVATISVTSSFQPGGEKAFLAAPRIGNANGRPGVNGLQVRRTITLPESAWRLLNDFVREAEYAFPQNYAIQGGVTVWDDRIAIGANTYVPGDAPAYRYTADRADVERLMKEVQNAAAYSNFTIFTMHTHQWSIDSDDPKGGFDGETDEPPDFLKTLAHEAIDNGADLVTFHGPFVFRAIEVYRGKPIFYSLGSFVRQAYQQDIVPWETYSEHSFVGRDYDGVNPLDTTVPDAQFLTTRTGRHPARFFCGASARCRYLDSKLNEIRLHPFDLGFDGTLAELGTPRTPDADRAAEILADIADRCQRVGTRVEISGGQGVIRPESD